jgi:hypothetical protein
VAIFTTGGLPATTRVRFGRSRHHLSTEWRERK